MRRAFAPLLFMALIVSQSCDDGIVPPPVLPDDSVSGKAELQEWLEDATEILHRTGYNGPMASRIMAYTAIAYYEGFAVGFDDMPTLAGKLNGLDSLPRGAVGETYNYALVSAASTMKVMSKMFQNDGDNNLLQISTTFNSMVNRYTQYGVSQNVIDRSVLLGYAIGDGIIAWINEDNYNEAIEGTFAGGTGADIWRPTPPSNYGGLLPNWWVIRPFSYTFEELFAICPPDAPTPFSLNANSEYMLALEDILQVTANLNTDQQNMAGYWADERNSFSISGHYANILSQLLSQADDVDGKEAARTFAQLSIALADIHIAAWQVKYDVQRIRPVSVIRYQIDPDWLSPIAAMPAPEFPSERAACAEAAKAIFIANLGDMAFTDSTYYTSDMGVRTFTGFAQMADEASLAQVYAGTELRATTEKSRYSGQCMADRVRALFQ